MPVYPQQSSSFSAIATVPDDMNVRMDFPIFSQTVYGKPLTFLDTAASAQKPQAVIDAIVHCYSKVYANIHRGVYYLSMQATEAFEAARKKIQRFINAEYNHEIIFVRGGTEAINLVASSFGTLLSPGDEIIVSEMEHHANLVPWQILRDTKGIKLRFIPFDASGTLDMTAYETMLNERTRLVAVTHVSNALGTVNPIRTIIEKAHHVGAAVLVDGCQAVPHMPVDVRALDADFYVFSGHKMYGPTGIGVLYGKTAFLEKMPPYQTGGEMIKYVTLEKTEFNTLPHKFEAGTPAIAEVIGLGAAADYLSAIGMDSVHVHGSRLLQQAREQLKALKGITIIGDYPTERSGIISFTIDNVHPHDAGTILDHEGVAVRAGHHCAFPVMQHYRVPATVRASFGIYNTFEDIKRLVQAIKKVQEVFHV